MTPKRKCLTLADNLGATVYYDSSLAALEVWAPDGMVFCDNGLHVSVHDTNPGYMVEAWKDAVKVLETGFVECPYQIGEARECDHCEGY